MNRTLRQILLILITKVGMEKLQKHLDNQAKKAAQRMLGNETSREIVAEEVAKNKEARAAVAQEMSDDELLAELRRRGLVP